MLRPGSGAPDYLAGTRISLAGATDRGRQRTSNQDSLALDEATGVAVVADGVGGELAGDVASAIVTRVVCDAVRKRLLAVAGDHINSIRLREHELALIAQAALLDAHCDVLDNAKAAGRVGMASTVALVLVHAELATISWAGDSSVFLLRDGTLRQLTRSHSLEEDLSGGRAASPGRRHKGPLTMAAGSAGDPFMPEVRHEPIRPGDILMLCSDGLTDMLEDSQVARIVGRHRASLDTAAVALLAAANDAGGEDNVTVALIGIHKTPSGLAADRGNRRAPNVTARLLAQARPAALALFMAGLVSGSLLTLAARSGLDPVSLDDAGPKPAEGRNEAAPQRPKRQASQASLGVPASSSSAPAKKASDAAAGTRPEPPTSNAPVLQEAPGVAVPPVATKDRMSTTPVAPLKAQPLKRATESASAGRKATATQEAASSTGGKTSPPTKSRRLEKAGPSTEDGQ